MLGGEDAGYDLVAERDAIASRWNELPDVECSVLELRFMHGLNQREIGERIGYSQMHVSRLLRRALSRLETTAAAYRAQFRLPSEGMAVAFQGSTSPVDIAIGCAGSSTR